MNVQVSQARSAIDFAEARALRRAVFEDELGYSYDGLDDELDDYSIVLLARHEGEAIATARLTARADGELEDEAQLQLERWTHDGLIDPAQIMACSRLVVMPAYRGRGVVAQLAARLYVHARERGAKLVFLDASAALVRYYVKLGFRPFRPAYRHALLGQEYWPLVLFIDDREHFVRVGSPLAKLVCEDRAQLARAVHSRAFATQDPRALSPAAPAASTGAG